MGRPKKKRGPITDSERIIILEKMAEGKSYAEISRELDRPQNTIAKHAKELKEKAILATNQEARSDSSLEATVIEIGSVTEESGEFKEVMLRLMIDQELEEREARARIIKCLNNAKSKSVQSVTAKNLYDAACKTMTKSSLFLSSSKEKGQSISVMSVAGSEAGDEVKNMKKSNILENNINNKTVFRI